MRFYRAGRRVAYFTEGVTSTVRTPKLTGGPGLDIWLDVLPRDRGAVGEAEAVLNRPLLLGSVHLAEPVEAAVKGARSVEVCGISDQMPQGGRRVPVSEGEGVFTHFV